ncbi:MULTISPECIES: sugar phosphate isomerase/epimerase [unclassified Cupriavidus]|uniref:sugar phosphate isomerase/epimerase family protein n=1 Tax=unclassified Cupriavidus TaxID=2640874 RepID=UPI000405DF44|nr:MULTISPECIES: TIM barrel protein [unclassified Cupriavidus]MBP0629683.1 TIM barrel protein [Cupriavidus sp. AcVe19-1a]MBP0636709.1 TIM barrel protein [Cupriavidus sp. AcVe19-6a]
MPQALVSLTAYGAELALREGQAALARIAAAAGADGVEYRGELQRGGSDALREQRAVAEAHGLAVVWSSPEGIWDEAGDVDTAALDRAFGTAHALGAARVKMSLGGYRAGAALDALLPWLQQPGIELVVENDQTSRAGTVPPLQDFFARTAALGRAVPMTFDMGNWHWTGEDPLAAAHALAGQVGYVHCKGVQRTPDKWIAVPLEASAAAWRSVLRGLPAEAPRAIEFPLQGADLVQVTRMHLATLRSAEVAA